MVGMSWDKVIDKEVKSADKQDLGKVESIVTNMSRQKKEQYQKNITIFQNTISKDMMDTNYGLH